jgi:hypothetical protein
MPNEIVDAIQGVDALLSLGEAAASSAENIRELQRAEVSRG